MGVISLSHIQGVQPPDYDKVDVGANGFSIVLSRESVDLSNKKDLFEHDPLEFEQLDYHVYAFTDSAFLHEVWNATLEEALEQYRENMIKRQEILMAKRNRRRLWVKESSSTATFQNGKKGGREGGHVSETIFEEEDEEDQEQNDTLVDLRFVS